MRGQRSVGILNQRFWRAVGARVDDCVVLADEMAALYCAPWVTLVGAENYRIAAGAPADGGMTIGNSLAAIGKLFPALHVTSSQGTALWPAFDAAMTAGGPASVSVASSLLPVDYGYAGQHRVAVVKESGAWLIGNPLDGPYDNWAPITAAQLRRAMEGYPGGASGGLGLFYVAFPTVEQAFAGHPLAVGMAAELAALQAQLAAIRAVTCQ